MSHKERQAALDAARDLLAIDPAAPNAPSSDQLTEASRSVQAILVEADQEVSAAEWQRKELLVTGTDAEVAKFDAELDALKRIRDRARALSERLSTRYKARQREEEIASLPETLRELHEAAAATRAAEAAARAARARLVGTADRYAALHREATRAGVEPPELSAADRADIENVLGRPLDVPTRRQGEDARRVIVDGRGGVRFEGAWSEREKEAARLRYARQAAGRLDGKAPRGRMLSRGINGKGDPA